MNTQEEVLNFQPTTNKYSAHLREKNANYQTWVAESNAPFAVNSLNSVYSTDIGQSPSVSTSHPLYAV